MGRFYKRKKRKKLILRWVVDTLSTLVETSDYDLIRQYLLHRIPAEGEINWNTFYLIKKGVIKPKFESFLLDLVDIIIELNLEKNNNGNLSRTLTLKKLRNKPYEAKTLIYKINEKFEILKSD